MSKKFGLGKGLGALIPEENDKTSEGGKILIPIYNIKSNIEHPRKSFDNDKIIELAESIKQHGIILPLIVS